MAEQMQQPMVNAAFPAPPSFYQHFTKANVELLESQRSLDSKETLQSTSQDLPSELRCLCPPTPPANGEYRSFGEQRSLSAPLAPLEVPKLHPDPPTPSSLSNLTRSLLLNFLEFLHILSSNPAAEEYGPKWDDLRYLFQNAHEVLNLYRPWQSREALIGIMEETVRKGREEVESVKVLKEKVEGVLASLGEGLVLDEEKSSFSEDEQHLIEQKAIEEERRVWTLITDEAAKG